MVPAATFYMAEKYHQEYFAHNPNQPYCLFVVGRTTAARDSVARNLRGAGLQAISYEAAEGLESDADFFHWAKNAIAAAKTVAKSVMVYGLADARRAALVASLGATHGSIRSAKSRPQ